MIEPGQELEAMLAPETGMVYASNIDSFTCGSSSFRGEETSTGNPTTGTAKFTLTELSIIECKDSFGNACTVTESFLPASGEISGGSASEMATFGFRITSKAGAHVECGMLMNCFIFVTSATFGSENRPGGAPLIKPNNVSLSSVGSFCPTAATLTATYELTAPHPLFVV
jgi:hypothetical protein